MLDELENWAAPFSRRHMPLVVVAAISAATVVNNDPAAAAEMKMSASAVGYQDRPNGDKQCSECVHFVPPSSCKMIEGTISPNGYCRIFARRKSAAARGRVSAFTG